MEYLCIEGEVRKMTGCERSSHKHERNRISMDSGRAA